MDPTATALPEFSFLDPKLLAQFVGALLLWVQFIKSEIPDRFVKPASLVSALIFTTLADSCLGGGCAKFIPPGAAKSILYAMISCSAAGIAFKAMTSKNGGEKTP